MKRFPFIKQKDSMQCGVACLASICEYYGKKYSTQFISKLCSCTPTGRVFKIALKSCAFFTYSIDALDHQIWRKVFIRPFLNVTVSSFLQSLFKFEINSSALICQIKAKRHHQNYRSDSCKFVIRHSAFHYSKD